MEYLTGSQLLGLLNSGNQMVSGMTAKEAAAALGASQLANGMYVKSFVQVAENVVQFPGTAAAGAAAAGTLTGGSTAAAANLTVTASAGTTTVGGILSVAGPIVAVAAAALGGFYIGTKINEANQEFFDNMIFPVLDKMFGNTTTVPVVVDSTGQTYVDKRIVDDVKDNLNRSYPLPPPGDITEVTEIFDTTTFPVKPTAKLEILIPILFDDYIQNVTNIPSLFISTPEATERWRGYFKRIGKWLDEAFPEKIIFIGFSIKEVGSDPPLSFILKIFDNVTNVLHYDNGQYYKITGDISDNNYITIASDSELQNYGTKYGISNIEDMVIFSIDDIDVDANSGNNKHFICTRNITYEYGTPILSYYDKYGLFHTTGTVVEFVNNKSNVGLLATSCVGKDIGFTAGVTNIGYISEESIRQLPEGITYKEPVLDDTLPTISVYTGEVNGCPQEVPYVPVRIPATDPKIIEFPTPDDNPQHDNNDPDKLTPFIPTEIPYPNNVPSIDPAPVPTPEENPDNLPTSLPSANPSNEPVVNPNPDIDPSTEIPTLPNVEVPDDPTENPIDNGEVITPSLPIPPIVPPEANGLFHVYNPTADQVNQFGAWLWTTFSSNLIDTLSKLFNNPMEAVIGLHELYVVPSTGSESTIKAGYLDSGITSRLVNKRYTSIDCGTVLVREYWGNYLDYSPYTKVQAYLPFIGIVDLHADDIIGRAINITYRIDAYTGACIAIITTATSAGFNAVTYQFSGNCAVEVPMSSGSMSSLQSALIGAVTAGIGLAVGGLGGAAAGGSIGASAGVIAGGAAVGAIHHKNDVAHSGTFGSAFGAMGLKKPYLIIKRPKQKVVRGYNKNYGYPAHKMVTIGLCSGYLKAREVDVVSSTATEEEKKMIEELLKSGIFVS